MRTRILVALAVTGLLLTGPAATPVAAQSTDPVTLTVSVVDQDGDPISNADVTATWENGSATETTASNGKAFIDVERGANVTITVSHPDYIRNHPFVVQNATEQDVTIPAYQQGQLSVVVADDSGGVADARIVLRQNGRIVSQVRTNESGVFASEPIEQGEYTVAVVKPGYFRNVTTVQVGASNRTRILVERGTVSLTVTVRDPHFSPPRPISNATVRIGSVGQLQTLAGGEARVSVPVNTDLSITVEKEEYNDVTKRVAVEESDLRVNVSANRTPSLQLEPMNTRVVAGERLGVRVVDEYSAPVEGAAILLDGEDVSATDADGRAVVTVEEPGNHTLAATKDGLNSSSVTIRAIPEEGETVTSTSTQTLTTAETSPGSGSSTPGFTPLTAVLAIVVSLSIFALRRR
jgi:uncharacterized GH25 family protein